MFLYLLAALLLLILSTRLWPSPDPRYHTIWPQRILEFLCIAPWVSWAITGCVGFVAWAFFIGDNDSLFFAFFHYVTYAAGVSMAAIIAFGCVRKSLLQWLFNIVLSLVMLTIFIGWGFMPSWDGFTPRAAAERAAKRVPLPSSYVLVPAPNPQYGGAFSSFDRTFLLLGPDEAIGRVVVRPHLPLYWTGHRGENYAAAPLELANALKSRAQNNAYLTTRQLNLVIDKYPGSKVAHVAEIWKARVNDPKFAASRMQTRIN
jgi:hypothetical protein